MLGQRWNRNEAGHLGSLPRPSWKEGAAIIDSSKKLSTGFAKVQYRPPYCTIGRTPIFCSMSAILDSKITPCPAGLLIPSI